jgi:pimeloyl-ACP methyl ester carboxylesterase
MKVIPITAEALEVMTNRQGDPIELIRRGIRIATAPGFIESQPDVVQELITYRLAGPVPPAAYTAQLMAGAGTAAWSDSLVDAHLAAIHVPTLILSGEHDRVVPPGNAGLLAAKIPQAQVKILPNTGHLFPIEDPAATVAAITEFCQD